MTPHLRVSSRAFTLIETVIVIAFSASIVLALGLLIYNFNKTSTYQQAFSQSSDSASATMRSLESLVMSATAVLQTHTFPSATYTSSATSLVLQLPSIDSSGNAIANTYDYAVFYVVGTNAYRLIEINALSKRTAGTKQLSSTMSALGFTYNDADFAKVNMVTIDVQTQAHVKQDVLSDHRREQVRLRNR